MGVARSFSEFREGRGLSRGLLAVSYTHLDVYKRQVIALRRTAIVLGDHQVLRHVDQTTGQVTRVREMCIRDRINIAATYTRNQANWSPLQSLNQVATPERLPIGLELRIPLTMICLLYTSRCV